MNKHNSSEQNAVDIIGGVLIGMVVSYLIFSIPNLLRGESLLDFSLLRNLCVLGILVIGFTLVEKKTKQRR